jgi:SAM-dependent methyltransferase
MPRSEGDAQPPPTTVPREHFDRVYADKTDPWELATSWYERRKHAITVASLPRELYGNAFEPGCATGELTMLLAPRCERLLAVDCTERAIARARSSLHEFGHVTIRQATMPADLPDGRYDLIVVSEILYYFCASQLDQMLDGLMERLMPGGDIVATHHRARDRCYGYDGYNVHRSLGSRSELTELVHHEDENFVLDILRRRGRNPAATPAR